MPIEFINIVLVSKRTVGVSAARQNPLHAMKAGNEEELIERLKSGFKDAVERGNPVLHEGTVLVIEKLDKQTMEIRYGDAPALAA